MRNVIRCCMVVGLVAFGGPARAEMCTVEAAPAATLLLPYFQVDLDNDAGVNTIFSINNASASAALTHVVVWTNMSIEVLDFNVYLTGYDMQTINLGLALKDGLLPITGNGEPESPVGPFSDDDGNSYPACDELGFPYDNSFGGDASCGELGCVRLADVQEILRGNESTYIYPGDCAALPTDGNNGSAIADGYVTVDLVKDCTLQTPCGQGWSNPDQGPYFGLGGLGRYENILWGDYFYIDGQNNFAQGDNLVHVQAAADENEADLLLGGSFYNRCDRYSTPYADYRESLASTFAAHYYRNAQFDGGTTLQIWRDSTYEGLPSLRSARRQQQRLVPDGPDPGRDLRFAGEHRDPGHLPDLALSAGRSGRAVRAARGQHHRHGRPGDVPSGWIYMNLGHIDGPNHEVRQNWVTQTHSAEGRFSVGYAAVAISDFCDLSSVILGESGDDFPAVFPGCSPFPGSPYSCD
ncbi:MAG: hypothetical protein R2862_09280 [Thermoanaerobaculia bacterium]